MDSSRSRKRLDAVLRWAALAALASCHRSGGKASGEWGSTLQVVAVVRASTAAPVAIDLDDTGRALLLAAESTVRVWPETVADGGPPFLLSAPGSLVAGQLVGVQGAFAATEEGTVVVWDWERGETQFNHHFGFHSRYSAISADGRYIAYGGSVVDRQGHEEVGESIALTTQSTLQFSAKGDRVLVAGFHDRRIVVRDLPSGALEQWWAHGEVSAAALNARGDRVAAAASGGEVRWWRLPGHEQIGAFRGYGEVRGVRFFRDGDGVVVADDAGISAYRVATSTRDFRGEVDGSLRILVVEGEIAAAATLTDVWVWSLATEKLLGRARVSSLPIVAIDLCPRVHLVAAASEQGETKIMRWE